MKTKTKYLMTIALFITLFSCGSRSAKEESAASAQTDSVSTNGFVFSSAAVEKGKDTTRKFIRTAEIKFRVKNVATTTYNIEDLTTSSGGFVLYTNLVSNTDYTTITPISADSSLETIHYTVSNEMTLRVPNTKLDSTLKSIATLIDYMDYRIIKANDVGLQMLSNRLTQNRINKHEQRLTTAIETRGKKLHETTVAEEALLNKEEQSDDAKISNLSFQDQIDFSTISLFIYQRQAVHRTVISNDKNIDVYEPGLGSQLLESIQFGWKMLKCLTVFITKFWALIICGFAIYFLIKKLAIN